MERKSEGNDVIFLPPARNYIKKIKDKKLKRLYADAVKKIQDNPECGQLKKGDLRGIYGYNIFYNKTNYELAYTVKQYESKTVVIIMAGTRENFYEQLKPYMKSASIQP